MTGIELLLAGAGAAASAAGAISGANAANEAGKSAQRNAQFQADALRRQALEQEAASQRKAITEEKKTELALSRVQAVSAASGGGADDPSVLDLMGNLAKQGAYNRDTALYEGTTTARGLNEQADLTLWKGDQARRAAKMNATSTILSGVSSFATAAGRFNSMGKTF